MTESGCLPTKPSLFLGGTMLLSRVPVLNCIFYKRRAFILTPDRYREVGRGGRRWADSSECQGF